ncbi:MAG: uL30 family ribosomal protein [Nanoarchaeota archaeon]
MIAIIRIRGQVGVDRNIKETLSRLRLRRKFICIVLIKPGKEKLGMVKKLRDFVAFGDIKEDTFQKLMEKRGRLIDKTKKTDLKTATRELIAGKKDYEELNIKPFFRLHPPRGGIDSKIHFPKGVLGDNGEEINKLIERML